MNQSSKHLIVAAAILILGFASVFALSNFVERNRISLPESYADQDLALQGKRLKGYALGAEGLMADWYWMWSLQYLGDKIVGAESGVINVGDLTGLNPRLLYPLLDNAAELDPKFTAAYSFGAIVLPAIDQEQAIALTEKGIKNNPDAWRLYQYLGYIHWRLGNYEKAAEAYESGSRINGSPSFMRMMSAAMRTQAGSRDTARAIYTQMLNESEDQQSKATAEFRLMELDSLDERDAIRAALGSFKNKNGRCANNWAELIPTLKDFIPVSGKGLRIDDANNIVDPSDAPYLLDKQACDVKLDAEKTKLPLQEPK